jgi:hypothetical protein
MNLQWIGGATFRQINLHPSPHDCQPHIEEDAFPVLRLSYFKTIFYRQGEKT